MKEIKYFELFAGIGAPRKAIENIGLNAKSIGFSEINNSAIKNYCLLYNEEEKNNYGNIKNIFKVGNEIDLLIGGFPCTNISSAGLSEGIKYDETASGLMYEMFRFIINNRPKWVITENVSDFLNKKNIHDHDWYVESLQRFGYQSQTIKIDSKKDCGTHQSRKRVFVISSTEEKPNIDISKFDEYYENFNDIIDNNFNEDQTPELEFYDTNSKTNKIGYFQKDHLDKRLYDPIQQIQSICTSNNPYYRVNEKIRRLNAKENIKAMGFDENDYNKMVGSESTLIKLAGNSIHVKVMEEIIKQIFKENDENIQS